MEDIFGYIILFSIGLGLLYTYQSRKLRSKKLPLSVQTFPECVLTISITKQHRKIQLLTIQIKARKSFILKGVFFEMITADRTINVLPLNTKLHDFEVPENLPSGKETEIPLPYDTFSTELNSFEQAFQSFRIVVEEANGKKYKSHELAFNSNWSLYKPDSGRYN